MYFYKRYAKPPIYRTNDRYDLLTVMVLRRNAKKKNSVECLSSEDVITVRPYDLFGPITSKQESLQDLAERRTRYLLSLEFEAGDKFAWPYPDADSFVILSERGKLYDNNAARIIGRYSDCFNKSTVSMERLFFPRFSTKL